MAYFKAFLYSLLLILVASEVSECVSSLKDLSVNNKQKLLKMVYHSGRDINDFGNQDLCEKIDGTRYILLSVNFGQFTLNLGICGPEECKAKDYEAGTDSLKSFLSENYPATEPLLKHKKIKAVDVNKYNDKSLSGAAIAALIVILFLVGLVITGTMLDKSAKPEKGYRGWKAIVVCFSITTNFDKLITFPQNTDGMQVFNGLKVLGMIYISLGHHFGYSLQAPSSNPIMAYSILKDFWMHLVFAPIYIVDIFFVIAGFLVAFLTIKELQRRKGKMNWVMYVVHRFIRICPIYFFSFMVFMNLFDHMGTGTLWPTMWMKYEESCKSWWSNLIFLNNFFPVDNYGCMGWAWYVANDMQFYIFSPIVLLVFYKSKKLGYGLLCLMILANIITLFTEAYINDYNPGIVYGLMDKDQFIHSYQKPYTRVSAYAMGMIFGFLYRTAADMKEKKPAEGIELVEKESETTLLPQTRMSGFTKNELRLIMWAQNKKYRYIAYSLSTIVMVGILFVPYKFDKKGTDYWPTWFKAFFVTFEHIVYSFAVIILLTPMIMGYGGIVFRFLSHKYFAVLSKITFSFYLFHPMVIIYGGFNKSAENHLEYFTMLFYYPTTLFYSTLIAIITTLCLESPVMSLEKVLFARH